MRKITIIGLSLLFSLGAIAQGDYIKKETEKRAKKDAGFKTGHHSNKDAHGHSPLNSDQKAKFKGLPYYSVDEKYNVEVDFVQYKNPDHATLMLTNGVNHHYWVVGKIKFKMNGEDCELLVYQDKKFNKHHKDYKDYMFIPFRDQTNGEATYGGGRYLQWHDPHGKHEKLDFNNAFNPASVYNEHIHDPIVPYVNTLPIKIEAGEKDFDL